MVQYKYTNVQVSTLLNQILEKDDAPKNYSSAFRPYTINNYPVSTLNYNK